MIYLDTSFLVLKRSGLLRFFIEIILVLERPLLSGDIFELDDESLLVGVNEAYLEALIP